MLGLPLLQVRCAMLDNQLDTGFESGIGDSAGAGGRRTTRPLTGYPQHRNGARNSISWLSAVTRASLTVTCSATPGVVTLPLFAETSIFPFSDHLPTVSHSTVHAHPGPPDQVSQYRLLREEIKL
jgi:hypothetical protein